MDRRSTSAPHDGDRESGFSLVEVIVAMVLLSAVAMAFLPLVLQATEAASTSNRLATASRLVSEQMESKRAAPNTICDDRAGVVVVATADPRGGEFRTHTDIDGPCPGTGIVKYDVWVTHSAEPTVRIASATTSLAMDGN
jgi:prepilin-type N-terminal cleavage/methylation domain-containing protein